jgi:hypothetical protein
MSFEEPAKITLRWRGQDWQITPVSAIDPKALAQLGSLTGILAILEEALGPEQYADFPNPRGVMTPTGKTEIEVFLDAWADASDEAVDSGESQPSPNS